MGADIAHAELALPFLGAPAADREQRAQARPTSAILREHDDALRVLELDLGAENDVDGQLLRAVREDRSVVIAVGRRYEAARSGRALPAG